MFDAAVPYNEPTLVTILILASFLLVLNFLGAILDNVLYCGLVGQVFVGMAWGTPGAKILSHSFEEVAMQLGYLGLICIVFEGGLSTSAKAIRTSLVLSISVALTGILLPIALSFSLVGLSHASRLQAFAAGSALCSTSLGTTFSLLKTTGLTSSRLGTVLTTAAMLDDVVGLIMVQVIANLGSAGASIHAATIVRPVLVSFGFAVILPVACRYLIRPMLLLISSSGAAKRARLAPSIARYAEPGTFVLSTVFLAGLITAASYAGTSILFAAYIAGAVISWIDETSVGVCAAQRRDVPVTPPSNGHDGGCTMDRESPAPLAATDQLSHASATTSQEDRDLQMRNPRLSIELTPPPEAKSKEQLDHPMVVAVPDPGTYERQSRSSRMYNDYYGPAVERILKPLFFASIGFSIPISKMFCGPIVWRGLLYALLMAVGKLFCGIWLIRFATARSTSQPRSEGEDTPKDDRKKQRHKQTNKRRNPLPRPKSVYPASLLGCAMVARGEIGFLISALAASNGVFTGPNGDENDEDSAGLASDIYLVVTWAILLCTILGPLALGVLTKRVRRLQEERKQAEGHGKEDPLGIWGI